MPLHGAYDLLEIGHRPFKRNTGDISRIEGGRKPQKQHSTSQQKDSINAESAGEMRSRVSKYIPTSL